MDISALMPARNAEETLVASLDSILAQTLAPCEVIVVDDGSTDSTRALASSHALGALVLEGPGLGPAAAINIAAEHAQGDWLAFLDADDLWEPDWLEVGHAAALGDCDAVIGDCEAFLDPGVTPEAAARLSYREGRQTGYLTGSLLIYRHTFLGLGGFSEELKTGFFIEFWSRFLASGERTTLTGTLALRRRIRPGTLSFRAGEGGRSLEGDFLAIARDAIRRKREGQ